MMYKEFIFLFHFIFLFQVVSANNKKTEIDSIDARFLYTKIRLERNDSLRHILAKEVFYKSKTYSDSGEQQQQKVLFEFKLLVRLILSSSFYYKEADRLFEYYDYIFDNDHLYLSKGAAKFYMAKYYYREGCYYESIKYYYESIEEYSKINDLESLESIVISYIKLGEVYNNIGAYELSDEVDTVLMKKYYKKKNLRIHLKNRILVYHASYKALLGNHSESISILKSIDPIKVFAKNSYLTRFYYKELSERYIEKSIIDSALFYIDKSYSNPKTSYSYDDAQKHIYKALAYYNAKKFKTSFYLINKAEKSNAFANLEKIDVVQFYRLKYLLYKQFNDPVNALSYHEVFTKEQMDLKNVNVSVLASAYSYKMKHKLELDDLEKQSKLKEQLYIEKKQLHIFYVISFGITLFLLIILLLYLEHKKQKQKLILEHARIKEVSEMRNTFLENISHEISTPITILLGYLRLINLNILDHDLVLQYLESAKRNATYIDVTFNDFLTALKLDKKPLKSNYKEYRLGAFLLESVTAFGVVGAIKSIDIYYKSNIGIKQKVGFDYDSLSKIVNNLISNALKYSSAHTSIHIDATINDSVLILSVKDEGIGILHEDQSKIFDRFFQSSHSNVQGGFGIGLSLVKSLATQLNGTIRLESELEVGSVFEVRLPLQIISDRLYTSRIVSDYKLINPCVENVIHNNELLNILVVDDSIEMVHYITDVLSEKYNCCLAFNGKEALEKIIHTDFDLIISDLVMPEMDGLLLKKELNTLKYTKDIPFILMTSSSKEYTKFNEKTVAGINDYIIKPFQENELTVRIDNLLERNVYVKELQVDQSRTKYSSYESKFIQKVCEIIIENMYDSLFSVQELAQQIGYSTKNLNKIVKEKTGLSPVKLILEYRLLKAYDLIVDKSYATTKEVIFAVGLSSRSYFNKVFLDRFGIKPNELMNKSKDNFTLVE